MSFNHSKNPFSNHETKTTCPRGLEGDSLVAENMKYLSAMKLHEPPQSNSPLIFLVFEVFVDRTLIWRAKQQKFLKYGKSSYVHRLCNTKKDILFYMLSFS